MTPQEAIRILHPDTTREALSGMDSKTMIQIVNEACLMACEALEKQIEKEAEIRMNGAEADFYCPSCGELAGYFSATATSGCYYCDCGQKLYLPFEKACEMVGESRDE